MQQSAKVIGVLSQNVVQVSIKRETACGHDCTSCGACGAQAKPIVAEVVNTVGARVGDNVLIESKTSRILGLAFIVYLLPLILLFAFYALFDHLFGTEGASILGAALGILCGVLISVVVNRAEAKKKSTSFIVRVID